MASEEVLIVAIVAIIVSTALAFALFARPYVRAGPDQALVVWGNRRVDGAHFRVLPPGSGMFIPPVIATHRFLDLSVHQFDLSVARAQTKQGTLSTSSSAWFSGLRESPSR